METQKKYDVVFPCGAAIRGVNDRVPVGTAITVWVYPATGGMQPTDDNGEAAGCAFCRRRRGRKAEMFYTEFDKANGTRPQGRWITCRVCCVRERVQL
jgi:hypothetical protein